MAEIKEATYTISRQDLAHGHMRSLDDLVLFRKNANEEYQRKKGLVATEAIGFDFKKGSSPGLRFVRLPGSVTKDAALDLANLNIVVTITDLALRSRELVTAFPIAQLSQSGKDIEIDLNAHLNLGFYGGLEIGVYVKPSVTDFARSKEAFWSESQYVHSSIFSYRVATDSSLFEINYAPFGDDLRDVLYKVDWLDSDVTRIPATSSFDVTINVDHKQEFELLQNSQKFGALGARFIFTAILREIIEGTLARADIDEQVTIESDSAHFHLKNLFDSYELDFSEYAALARSESSSERSEAADIAARVAQLAAELGGFLSKQQFSGERRA